MKNRFRHVLTLTALLAAAHAWAGDPRPVDERRPLKPDAHVAVINTAGLIEVEAWDRGEIHITGELSDEVEALEIKGSESSLRIEVKLPKHTRNVEHTTLRIKAPAGISLEAAAVSADVAVKGLRGDVRAESVSGDIRLDVGSKRVDAASVSGDVTVSAPSEDTRVESVSGDVTVRGGRRELRGESVSGDVRVQLREVRRLELETVSGDLDVDVDLAADAEVDVETLSGQVRLVLPELPKGGLEFQTFSGEIESDFALGRSGRQYSRDGDGRGQVELNTFSGDIELRKRK